jgi:hypothetical protein
MEAHKMLLVVVFPLQLFAFIAALVLVPLPDKIPRHQSPNPTACHPAQR